MIIMTDQPQRIQLRRTKGWRLPPNTVVVARPTKWGNPFTIALAIESGFVDTEAQARPFVVECFKDWLGRTQSGRDWWQGKESDERKSFFKLHIHELRGKNLACWCPAGCACHADVLLEMANRDPDLEPLLHHTSAEHRQDGGMNQLVDRLLDTATWLAKRHPEQPGSAANIRDAIDRITGLERVPAEADEAIADVCASEHSGHISNGRARAFVRAALARHAARSEKKG